MEGNQVVFAKDDSGEVDFTVDIDNELFVKERTTLVFDNSKSKKTLTATFWIPKGELKAAVFVCHGYGEYFGINYNTLSDILTRQGILVFGHDHVGHGRSSGQRVQVLLYFRTDQLPLLSKAS